MLATAGDLGRPVPGLRWTVGETAAHLLNGLAAYTDALLGRDERWAELIPAADGYAGRMAVFTSAAVAAEPQRDAATLSRLLSEATAAFLQTSAGRSAQEDVPTPWYGEGVRLQLATATCLLTGEQLIHGLDIARGLRRPWPISKQEALLIAPAVMTMMPLVLDAGAAQKVHAAFRLRLRGGPSVALLISRSSAQITPWSGDDMRVDCTLSADPVAFLLLGYGRVGQWPLILSGRITSYGRKPWLALSLRGLFGNP